MTRFGLVGMAVLGAALTATGWDVAQPLSAAEAATVRGGCCQNTTFVCKGANTTVCADLICTPGNPPTCPSGNAEKELNGYYSRVVNVTTGGSATYDISALKYCTVNKACGPGCVWNGSNDVCNTGLPVGGTPTSQTVEAGNPCTGS
jgi:hypothetical protein